MVLLVLYIKADLENVAKVSFPADASWCVDVKDSQGEDRREGVHISPTETIELSGSRGTANYAMKWAKDAKHQAYANIQQVKNLTREITAADNGKFVPVIGFECRGLEIVGYHPEDSFIVQSEGGKVWRDVDISDKEWADYDDEAGDSVSIMELEWKIEAHKEK